MKDVSQVSQGGSYIRKKDGSLERVEFTAPAETNNTPTPGVGADASPADTGGGRAATKEKR